MTRQLPLNLAVRTALGRGDFLVSPSNAAALDMLDAWTSWPEGRLVLVGAAGAGKSHLAQVWARDAGARILDAEALSPAALDPELDRRDPLAVEDADRIAGRPEAERALFHLLNLTRETRRALLLTARSAPARWPVSLPDLASRLQAIPTARIEPPDEALLAAVIVKLFADRQLSVGPELVGWLVRRIDRSLAEAARVVDLLDRAALARKRPVTRQLAAEVLAETGPGPT